MAPGILDDGLELKPLRLISPSRYYSLHECQLREVWAAGRQQRLLPTSPAARLGSVIHSLLEEAASGTQTANEGQVERRWDELVAASERSMSGSWLDAHLVPLGRSVRDYEVRRLRAVRRAKETAPPLPPTASFSSVTSAPATSEMWVQSSDGLVGGYIDRVDVSATGPILRDYKTGSIRETAPGHGGGKVKESYAVQIKLYAALYVETTGVWPHKLELVPLQGEPVEVQFSPAESLELLDQARAALNEVNAIVTSPSLPRDAILQALANPGERVCQFCPYRPGCTPYHRARLSENDGAAWPADVRGELVEMRQLGNTKMLIVVQPDRPGSAPIRIRDVSPAATRHPALRELQNGDIVGLYNLLAGRHGSTLSESILTVIYKHVADIRGHQ